MEKSESKTIIIKATSLDYDCETGTIQNSPFEYDEDIECALCGTVICASSNNFFLTHCPHCNLKFVKDDMPVPQYWGVYEISR